MKKNGRTRALTTLAAFCLATMTGGAAPGDGKTAQELYQESVKLYQAQKYEEALKNFEAIVRQEPRFVHARSYAAKCREAIAAGKKPTHSLEGQLAQLTVNQVEFVNTDLGSVFEYLSQQSEELSGGKVVANFIYEGTDEQKRNTTVTLKLRNVPFTRLLDYIGQLSNTRFTYDEFAVVARPGGSAPPAQPQPAATETAKKSDLSSKFD